MSISIDSSTLYDATTGKVNATNTTEIEKTLSTDLAGATDNELMDVCESFETYFVEQLYKEMKKTVHSSDSNEYTEAFDDMLTTEYAENITETGQLGIAQLLYDSMKR